jgi:hypothetical protein
VQGSTGPLAIKLKVAYVRSHEAWIELPSYLQ